MRIDQSHWTVATTKGATEAIRLQRNILLPILLTIIKKINTKITCQWNVSIMKQKMLMSTTYLKDLSLFSM